MIEQIDELPSELNPLPFADCKIFMHTQIELCEGWPAHRSVVAIAESPQGGINECTWIDPLNALLRAGEVGFGIARCGDAVRPGKTERAIAAGSGEIGECQTGGHGISTMNTDNRADFPAADDGVRNPVHIATHCFTVSERQLIVGVGGKHVSLIEVARSPFRLAIINILPE